MHIARNHLIIGAVVGAVVFFGGGYFAGKTFGAPQRGGQFGQFSGQFGARAGGQGAAGVAGRNLSGIVAGTILSKDDDSITVQLGMGGQNASSTGSRIVILGGSTQVGKFTTGSAADLTVGANVTVTGTSNSDGSITAQQIQIRPAGQAGGGFGAPRGR